MKYAILFVLLILLFSCVGLMDSGENLQVVDLSNYFPLEIGNDWIYESRGSTEYSIIEKLVVDTLRDVQNNLVYKMKSGTIGFPPGSYLYEYYCCDSDGIWEYFCITDTCYDSTTNVINPEYKYLILKSSTIENEIWGSDIRHFQFLKLDTHRVYIENRIDTIFQDVAVLKKFLPYGSAYDLHYYAPEVGFIGTKDVVKIMSYHIK